MLPNPVWIQLQRGCRSKDYTVLALSIPLDLRHGIAKPLHGCEHDLVSQSKAMDTLIQPSTAT